MARCDGKLECACIYNFRHRKQWASRKCHQPATREINVHQEHEHPKAGTGWYWIPMCEKHFNESDYSNKRDDEVGESWRYIRQDRQGYA